MDEDIIYVGVIIGLFIILMSILGGAFYENLNQSEFETCTENCDTYLEGSDVVTCIMGCQEFELNSGKSCVEGI